MKRNLTAYQYFTSGLRLAVCIVFLSFSPLPEFFGEPEPDLIPSGKLLKFSLPESYRPEFGKNADSVIIPLKRAGNLFLIEGTVDGEHGNLVFDTGANGLVLNSTYFRDHLKTGSVSSNGITGAVGEVQQVKVDQLEFSALKYKDLKADLANLGPIENRRKVKIIGLVGFSMLRSLEIVIDPETSELKLFRIDKKGERQNSGTSVFQPDYAQKMETKENIVFLEGMVGGKSLRFCFDTGAETNAINSFSNKKVLNTLTITRRTELKGASAGGAEVLFGRMNDFVFGSRQIKNMETVITDMAALSAAYGTAIDGMLGYSFLKQGTVCINFVKNQFGVRYTKGDEK